MQIKMLGIYPVNNSAICTIKKKRNEMHEEADSKHIHKYPKELKTGTQTNT